MTDLADIISAQFDRLEMGWMDLLETLSGEISNEGTEVSRGLAGTPATTLLIRSAGRVEQAFGGLTARLWDDPFEWTLPEELATYEAVAAYLKDVATLRRRGMSFIRSDRELFQSVPAPEKLRTIAEVLLSALFDSAELLGQARSAARPSSSARRSTTT